MIREDLVAERIAIESYREIIQFFGDKDPTSRTLMESILAKEEEHADDLADLLFAIGPDEHAEPTRLYAKDEVPGKGRSTNRRDRPGRRSGADSRDQRNPIAVLHRARPRSGPSRARA